MKHPLLKDNVVLLEQTRTLASQIAEDHYPVAGSHFRHVADHYKVFLNQYMRGAIDYDLRDRDTELEFCRALMLDTLDQIIDRIMSLELDPDSSVQVNCATCVELPISGSEAAPVAAATSTIGRELIFLHGHTVHHLALVSLKLQMHGVAVMPEIGVAPSTLRFHGATHTGQTQPG